MGTEELVETADGVELWTCRSGSGPPMVLCHGGPGLWYQLEPVAEMVEDLVTVVGYDQRGAGRSSPVGPFSVATFVADLESLRQYFGHDRWVVAGHSWGASLALCYALRYPERVDALVYLSGTGLAWREWRVAYHREENRRLDDHQRRRRDELLGGTSLATDLASGTRSAAEDHELRILHSSTDFADRDRALELAERWDDARFSINYGCNQTIGNEVKRWDEAALATQCRRLSGPMLIVHGADDPRPFAAVGSLIDAVPDPTVELLPGVGHLPWAEHPELLHEVFRGFLLSRVCG